MTNSLSGVQDTMTNRSVIVVNLFVLGLLIVLFSRVESVDAQATAFTWEMEPRFDFSWTAWDEYYQAYSQSYVYPNRWWLKFDACNSSLGTPGEIQLYRWHIEGLDGITYGNGTPFDFEVVHTDCYYERSNTPEGSRRPLFLEQGNYRVTLTAEFYDNELQIAEQVITVKDILIVSIGDSSAAGEGNPLPASANNGNLWWDQGCHRSHISGHALAAKQLEDDDPHTSVTFLSFACSGAAIMKGLVLDYNGVDELAEGFVLTPRPQLKSIIKHLCHSSEWTDPEDTYCIDNPRQIDMMFIAIGVNDLKFGSLIKRCNELFSLTELGAPDLILPGFWEFAVSTPNLNWNKFKTNYCEPDEATDWWAEYEDMNGLRGLQFLRDLFAASANLEAPVFECSAKMDPITDLNLATLHAHFDLLDIMLAGNVDEVVDEITDCDAPYHEFAYRWMPLDMKRELIHRHYGHLTETMRNTLQPKEIYLTSYPANIFGNDVIGGGCGSFSQLDSGEAKWFYETGVQLNRLLKNRAEKYGWYYIDGIVEAFEGHDYCSNDPYFVGLFESIYGQSDVNGTVHPNEAGHAEIARRIVETVNDSNKPGFEDEYLVRVQYDTVKVTDDRADPDTEVELKLYAHDRWMQDQSLLVKRTIPVGEAVSLADYSFYAYLNQFDYVQVQAGARFSDVIQTLPKCDPSIRICNELLKGPRPAVGSGYNYEADNNFSNEYWCVRTQTLPYYYENSCTRTASHQNGSIELSYRIKVYILGDLEIFVGEDWRFCGNECFDETDVELAYPSLFAYQQTTVEASPMIDEFMTLLTPDQLAAGKLLALSRQNEFANDMVIQPDGRILIVSNIATEPPLDQQVLLVRLNPNGTFDETFGQGGKVIMGLTGDDFTPVVALTPSGKIVVAGTNSGEVNHDFTVWRFNTDGSLDQSFNASGSRTLGIGGEDYVGAVMVQPDEKILVAGHTTNGSNRWVTLVRFNANGSLDTSFDGDGKSRIPFNATSIGIRDAILQPNGKIVLVGERDWNGLVLQYHPYGTLDASFSSDGIYELDMLSTEVAQAVDLLPNGLLAIGAYKGGDFALFFLQENGSPCTTSCGLEASAPWLEIDAGGTDLIFDVLAQPDGKVLLVGATLDNPPGSSKVHLVRYRYWSSFQRYVLDTSFGVNGQMSLALTERDFARAVALTPDLDIILAGEGQQYGQNDVLLWRLPSNIEPPDIRPTLTQTDEQAILTWPTGTFFDEGYIVWRSEDPNFTLAGLGAEKVAEGHIDTHTIPSADIGQPYYYAVGGLNNSKHHRWSTEIFNAGVEAPSEPTAPTITLLSPNGGETLQGDTLAISWAANDLNDDALTFYLQYSPDNGTTWHGVAENISDNHIDIDANILGSSSNQGLFRVWATDGVNTANDQSDTTFSVTISARPPQLGSVEPSFFTVGDPGTMITVTGTDFNYQSRIVWNGSLLDTTFVNATTLQSMVEATSLHQASLVEIEVVHAEDPNLRSTPYALTIFNPQATISTLTPNTAQVGTPSFTLTVDGVNFVSGAMIRWNGQPKSTTFISNSQLQSTITTEDLAVSGEINVSVLNPEPNQGASNAFRFTVTRSDPPGNSYLYLPFIVK